MSGKRTRVEELKTIIPSEFLQKYGSVGEKLAEGLPRFSLELIGLTAKYLMFANPSSTNEPVEFLTRGSDVQWTRCGCFWRDDALEVLAYNRVSKERKVEILRPMQIEQRLRTNVYTDHGLVGCCGDDAGRTFILSELCMQVYDAAGNYEDQYRFNDEDDDVSNSSIAIDKSGQVYVGVARGQHIHVLRPDLTSQVLNWTKQSLEYPYDVAVVVNPHNQQEEVWINDRRDLIPPYKYSRILRFHTNGEFIDRWSLMYPTTMTHFDAVDDQGRVYSIYHHSMIIFTFDGEVITRFNLPAGFKSAKYVCVGRDRAIYVIDQDDVIHAFGYCF